ncbi:hypothetical protein ECHHL_0610 [Ehrlichia chaffeensis str. Heartland]|nr:hypothetical protein ECHHL_0610 [Ehrlichia chaffeensis str. Heartland]AHX06502.1 hypothetical protein ECHLIB_0441 [Ehrlichia chaffeensis str. Liberty]AHX08433.1 hypothetical protein ECHSTV_0433 [Ehrlichia chaffeensis str. Saint Vincent]AHX09989.1 hypothetical protein ECHWAK_0440 [Ehrlichia chaffeensis str. Wakulla]AHX10560.1 hypothetical protein ECHWP_0607 [Ehrlichia chaffeensis str. West Paces]
MNDIIEIKSQIVNILDIQIEYLKQLDFSTVKDLQCIEKELLDLLNCKRKKIKSDISIISSCHDQNIIELLNSVYLNYKRVLKIRNDLLV